MAPRISNNRRRRMKKYNIAVLVLWIAGIVALLTYPIIVPLLWALPAGDAAGKAFIELS